MSVVSFLEDFTREGTLNGYGIDLGLVKAGGVAQCFGIVLDKDLVVWVDWAATFTGGPNAGL